MYLNVKKISFWVETVLLFAIALFILFIGIVSII